MRLLAVAADRWPFPWGYGYRNILGNVLASVVWAGPPFLAGVLWGKRRARRADEHRKWMAEHLANIHRATTGEDPAEHPEHGAL